MNTVRPAVDRKSAPRSFTSDPISRPPEFVTAASGHVEEAAPLDEPSDPVAEMRRVLRERTEAWDLAQSDQDSAGPARPWRRAAHQLRARAEAALGRSTER